MSTARRSRSFWEQLVREVEDGDTVAEVARRRRVKAQTLAWWRWQLRRDRPEPRLLPVVATATAEISTGVEVFVGDVRVVVDGRDVSYVAALVRALRAC